MEGFDLCVLVLSGLTGPFALTLLPVGLLIAARRRTPAAVVNLSVVTVAAIAQVCSILISGQRHSYPITGLTSPIKMIVGQIFTGGILGQAHIGLFADGAKLYMTLGVGLALLLYVAVRAPDWMGAILLFGAVVFVSALLSLTPVPRSDVWAILTQPGAGHRYWFIPILAWLASLSWLAFRGKPLLLRPLALALLLLCLVVGIRGSWEIAAQPDRHFSRYVRQFDSARLGSTVEIPINPSGWGVALVKQ